MTIGHLARAGGVGVETIRFYQRRGLLAVPSPTTGAVRRYDRAALDRLQFIRTAQAAGFTLAEIGALLALDPVADRARINRLARDRIAALDIRMAALVEARDALARLADVCSDAGDGPCPIVGAFGPATSA